VYFNVNFNVFFLNRKVHFLVSELYIYKNARCNNKENSITVLRKNSITRIILGTFHLSAIHKISVFLNWNFMSS